MSESLSLGQVVAIILVSSTLSVGANLAITSYAPGLVPMPTPKPDMELTVITGPSTLRIPQESDWNLVPELSGEFKVTRDSTVLILLTSSFGDLLLPNALDASSDLEIIVRVDAAIINPRQVAFSHLDYQRPNMAYTMMFVAPNLKQGTHTLEFIMRNRGRAIGAFDNPVVAVMSIPSANTVHR